MPTLLQWIHVGGVGFLVLVLVPSGVVLQPDRRKQLLKADGARFRWVSWAVIVLLLASGFYNLRQYYWGVSWGRAWELLAAKIALALVVFAISLCLIVFDPAAKAFDRFRMRRKFWLTTAFTHWL